MHYMLKTKATTYRSELKRILHQRDRRYQVLEVVVTERAWNKSP